MQIDPTRAEAIFSEALAKPTPAERAAYLDGSCRGDVALRARVDDLLGAHKADSFLEPPPVASNETLENTPVITAGTIIGRYKLLQLIGEGGFGSVYLAEQQQPVHRRVAVKIIKLGMDTRQVIARFEAERQALAMMDHPSIARVLDAGATDTGRPYFVMELVKGDPIVEYCDKQNLSITDRLGLFVQICQAVQHAHQKGIIHRDLKPTNVLVSTQDGRPCAKVIDFGIAKATSARLTEKTLFTEHRQLIGTPEYMSPEQAEGSLDIDTRTDVYSLGVLLYELLTGVTPFDAKQLRSAAYGEMQRIIRDVEPPKPSTRLSTNIDTLASVAAHRHSDPKKLGPLVRGELDWIVMKSLEKDRSRRYETANGFAMDVQRYLSGDPVTAGAPGAGYKLRKFVKRNRAKVIAAGVVAGVLVLGVIGTTTGMVKAINEGSRANAEATKATLAAASEAKAKVAAQENEQIAIAEAKRAEAAKEQEAKARKRAETISAFVTTALKASDAQNTGGGQEMTILAAMDNAIKDIDSGRFKDDPEIEAGLKSTIAEILLNNGRPAEAEPLFVQALETSQKLHSGDHPTVASGLGNLAAVRRDQGRLADAEPLFIQALEMLQRLYKGDHASVATALSNLASVRLTQHAIDAEQLCIQALEMNQRLFKGDHPDVAQGLSNLAFIRQALGRAAEAEPLLVQALEMDQRLFKDDHPDVSRNLTNLAGVRQELGRLPEAEALFVRALEMKQRLYKGDHPSVATALGNVASLRQKLGRAPDAEPLYVQALEMSQRLFKGDHPAVVNGLNNVAFVRQRLGRAADAEPLFVQALEMSQRLNKGDDPDVARALTNLAGVRQDLGRLAEAEPLFVQSLEMWQRLYKSDHPIVVMALSNLAIVRLALGRAAEAEPLFLQSMEMRQRLYKGDHTEVAINLIYLARSRQALEKTTEARKGFDEAAAMLRRLSPEGSPLLARALWRSGSARLDNKDAAGASPELEAAVAMAEKLLPPENPELKEYRQTLAKCKAALAEPDTPGAKGAGG